VRRLRSDRLPLGRFAVVPRGEVLLTRGDTALSQNFARQALDKLRIPIPNAADDQ